MAKDKNFGEILDLLENDYASAAADGTMADVATFIDTGSYAFNALLCGSIYGGIGSNKIIALAGEEATGKTFFALSLLKNFLDKDPEALAILFESESAITKKLLEERNIDAKRVLMVPVVTIQQFKTQALRIVKNHLAKAEKERKPLMFILDSLGMLTTSKAMADTESGKEVKDMTRASVVKEAFMTLTNSLGLAQIPMIVTNHVYQTMGMFPTKEMSGGSGLKYAASVIVGLGKSKDKDADGVLTGAIIRCKNIKSRFTREGAESRVLLSFDRGLDRFYGLVDIAVDAGVFKKVSTKIETADGTTHFEKHIVNNPEKYFTKDVLDKIDAACIKKYSYGMPDPDLITEEILNGKE